jgi:hypothetical protein
MVPVTGRASCTYHIIYFAGWFSAHKEVVEEILVFPVGVVRAKGPEV